MMRLISFGTVRNYRCFFQSEEILICGTHPPHPPQPPPNTQLKNVEITCAKMLIPLTLLILQVAKERLL